MMVFNALIFPSLLQIRMEYRSSNDLSRDSRIGFCKYVQMNELEHQVFDQRTLTYLIISQTLPDVPTLINLKLVVTILYLFCSLQRPNPCEFEIGYSSKLYIHVSKNGIHIQQRHYYTLLAQIKPKMPPISKGQSSN